MYIHLGELVIAQLLQLTLNGRKITQFFDLNFKKDVDDALLLHQKNLSSEPYRTLMKSVIDKLRLSEISLNRPALDSYFDQLKTEILFQEYIGHDLEAFFEIFYERATPSSNSQIIPSGNRRGEPSSLKRLRGDAQGNQDGSPPSKKIRKNPPPPANS